MHHIEPFSAKETTCIRLGGEGERGRGGETGREGGREGGERGRGGSYTQTTSRTDVVCEMKYSSSLLWCKAAPLLA